MLIKYFLFSLICSLFTSSLFFEKELWLGFQFFKTHLDMYIFFVFYKVFLKLKIILLWGTCVSDIFFHWHKFWYRNGVKGWGISFFFFFINNVYLPSKQISFPQTLELNGFRSFLTIPCWSIILFLITNYFRLSTDMAWGQNSFIFRLKKVNTWEHDLTSYETIIFLLPKQDHVFQYVSLFSKLKYKQLSEDYIYLIMFLKHGCD